MTRRRDKHRRRRRAQCPNPYVLLVANTADQAHDGVEAHSRHAQFIDAINAFIHADAPYKAIVVDDGHRVRDLNHREQALLEHACSKLGLDLDDAA